MGGIFEIAGAILPRIFGIIDQFVLDKDVAEQLKAKLQSEGLSIDHAEQMAIYKQFAAEFGHSKNAFDSFVDGMNRLVRPIVTYGVIGMFFYAATRPAGFESSMSALSAVPTWLWALFATVIGFWFGGRALKDWKQFSVVGNIASEVIKLPKKKPERQISTYNQ